MRAPKTTSTDEALRESLGELELIISDMIENEAPGFCNGWISTLVIERDWSDRRRLPSSKAIAKIIKEFGYKHVGRAPRVYFEDHHRKRAELWFKGDSVPDVKQYGADQGYKDYVAPPMPGQMP